MLGGRSKLPILAEISGPDPDGAWPWSLRRRDLERLGPLRDRIEWSGVVLVSGVAEAIAALAPALAGGAASDGRRTVLVESDLAHPRLAAELGLSEEPGLHEYLRWEASPREVLQPLALGGPASGAASEPLLCVAAGRPAADPATLLGLASYRHMLAKLRAAYDLVVIWGPPLAEAESVALAADGCDGVFAALSPDATSRRASRAVQSALRQLPVAAFGAVVVGGG